jgi:hypothetical protein
MLCLTVVPLPPSKKAFAVKINKTPKHNRSLKVAVQGLDYCGPPLIHPFIHFKIALLDIASQLHPFPLYASQTNVITNRYNFGSGDGVENILMTIIYSPLVLLRRLTSATQETYRSPISQNYLSRSVNSTSFTWSVESSSCRY